MKSFSNIIELCKFVSKIIKLINFVYSLSLETFASSSNLLVKYLAFADKFFELLIVSDIFVT